MKESAKRKLITGLLLLNVFSLHGQNFEMEKYVLSSGGSSNEQVSGGQFEMSSSVGQITTEKSTGGQFAVQAGFWQVNDDLIFENEFE